MSRKGPYPSYLLIIGISLLVFLWFGERHLAGVAFSQEALDLEGLARVAGRQAMTHQVPEDPGEKFSAIDRLCKELGGLSSARPSSRKEILVILAKNRVGGSSISLCSSASSPRWHSAANRPGRTNCCDLHGVSRHRA
jgi:hypothetical protein